MADVERLLTATLVQIAPIDPEHSDARHGLGQFFAELDRRFDAGFDPARSIPAAAEDLRPPAGLLLVATRREEPIGRGALTFHGTEPTEIKRMWVDASARGLGVGRRLLEALESHALQHARQRGQSRIVHLETNRSLTEAIAM